MGIVMMKNTDLGILADLNILSPLRYKKKVGFGMPIVYRPVSLHVHMDVRPFTA
jgi:hypothetical protein